ncbi:MAG: glycoside hydrolase family 57 protein [Candidatus Saccharimonas sp.]
MSTQRGIVLYLHVHQPLRIRQYTVFDTAESHQYFEGGSDLAQDNRAIFEKVADKSYRPMNAALQELLEAHPEFKVSLSITGTFIEQAEAWAPDVLESFQKLVATGRVEIVAETYYHSLAFFYSRSEFEQQVELHRAKIKELFGIETKVFRNTELCYDNNLADWADKQGYIGILSEGWDPILGWRSPNYVYKPVGTQNIKLLMKNYRLSDDVAFRFSNKEWEGYPLSADTYDTWVNETLGDDGQVINLFMDYETFGEHQWADTGIFSFFKSFVGKWLANPANTFYTVSGACEAFEAADTIDAPYTITWADAERDLTAWLGNDMQQEAMRHIYDLESDVLRTEDSELIDDWRRMTTSDHPYYMCTKWFTDGDVHAYFSPYDSPYEAFLYYMNALRDIRYRISEHHKGAL